MRRGETFLPITPRHAIEGIAVIFVVEYGLLKSEDSAQPRFGQSANKRGCGSEQTTALNSGFANFSPVDGLTSIDLTFIQAGT